MHVLLYLALPVEVNLRREKEALGRYGTRTAALPFVHRTNGQALSISVGMHCIIPRHGMAGPHVQCD